MHEPFRQDNAPAHTSIKTKNFVGKMGSLYLKIGLQSLDLNIIENLWSGMPSKIFKKHPKTLEELWHYAQEEFVKIPFEYIVKLYCSILRQLQLIVAKRGYLTKY